VDGTLFVQPRNEDKIVLAEVSGGRSGKDACFFATFNLEDVDESQIKGGYWAHVCRTAEGVMVNNYVNGYECACPAGRISRQVLEERQPWMSEAQGNVHPCFDHSDTSTCCPGFFEVGWKDCRASFGACMEVCDNKCDEDQICVLQNSRPRCVSKISLRTTEKHSRGTKRVLKEVPEVCLLEGESEPSWAEYWTIVDPSGKPLKAEEYHE
jgi:hypothetical protein